MDTIDKEVSIVKEQPQRFPSNSQGHDPSRHYDQANLLKLHYYFPSSVGQTLTQSSKLRRPGG